MRKNPHLWNSPSNNSPMQLRRYASLRECAEHMAEYNYRYGDQAGNRSHIFPTLKFQALVPEVIELYGEITSGV